MQQNRCHFDARKKLQKRSASTTRLRVEALEWRRRWDSNPRAGSSPTKRFRANRITSHSVPHRAFKQQVLPPICEKIEKCSELCEKIARTVRETNSNTLCLLGQRKHKENKHE